MWYYLSINNIEILLIINYISENIMVSVYLNVCTFDQSFDIPTSVNYVLNHNAQLLLW